MTNVGEIFLNLKINSMIETQLENIKKSITSPAEKIGKTISEKINNTEIKAPEIDTKGYNSGIDSLSERLKNVYSAIDIYREKLQNLQQINMNFSDEEVGSKKWEKTVEELEKVENKYHALENTAEKLNAIISGKENDFTQKLQEKLSTYNIPTEPVKALENELENTNFKLDILQKKWQELSVAEPSEKINSQLQSVQNQIISTTKKAEKIKVKISEFDTEKLQQSTDKLSAEIREKLGNYKVPTTPVERLQEEIEITNSKIGILQKKWQELSASEPTGKINSQLLTVQMQIISTTKKAEKLKEQLEKIQNAETGKNSSKFSEISAKIGNISSKIKNSFSEISSKVGNISGKINQVFSVIGKSASVFGDIAKKVSASIKKSFSSAFAAVKNVGVNSLKKLKTSFSTLASPVKKLGKYLISAFKRTFITSNLFTAFRAMRTYIAESLKANEKFSASLNQVKSNLAIAFTPIINAVMPALNRFMSGLASITRSVAGFISGIFGMTFKQAADATKKLQDTTNAAKKAKLTTAGIDEMNILSLDDSEEEKSIDFTKIDMSEPEIPDWAELLRNAIKKGDWYSIGKIFAERINTVFSSVDWQKIQIKINESVKNITDSINGFIYNIDWKNLGNTVANGLNTAFDAMYNFYHNVDWDKLGNSLAISVNSLFENVDFAKAGETFSTGFKSISDAIINFLQTLNKNQISTKISDFVGNIDTDGITVNLSEIFIHIGDIIADGINIVSENLNYLYEKIDFEKLGRGISKGLNNAISKINWNTLGKSIGKSIQSVVDIIHRTVTYFNWKKLGKLLGDSVNSIFENIDFAKAGETISNAIKGIFYFLINFVQTVKWQNIGEKIAEFLANIDFSGIVEKAFELLGSAFSGAFGLLCGLVSGIVEKIRNYFENEVARMDTGSWGADIILGLLVGIGDAIIGIGKWIYNNIFKPFIDGFKKAFDIHSPSKVMEKMGGFIIDGLFNAISSGISKIKDIFTKMREKIKEIFEKIHVWFENKFNDAYKRIQAVFSGIGEWFSKRWSDIKKVFESVGTWFKERFESAYNNIKNTFSDIGEWFENRRKDVENKFSDIGSWFKEKFESARNNINEKFENIGEWFGIRRSEIEEKFSNIGSWFKERFQAAYTNVTEIWSNITGFFGGLWNGISEGAKNGVNFIIGHINRLLSSVQDGINRIVDGLNSALTVDIPSEVPVIGGTHFGLNMEHIYIPQIPLLAKGGLATEPTLAMIDDNRNAKTDPEVVAPLSKLSEIMGENEIVNLLNIIIGLLKNGTSVELNEGNFSRQILKIVHDDSKRRGL